jgi:hypothetical protein
MIYMFRAILVNVLFVFFLTGINNMAYSSDSILLPDKQRCVWSKDRNFKVLVQRPEKIAPDIFPIATLFRYVEGKKEIVWSLDLPIHVGPRYILVADDGVVLFVDEWIRKRQTDYALMIIDQLGKVKSTTLGAVFDMAGAARDEALKSSRFGGWISTEPKFITANEVLLGIGGKDLLIDLHGDISSD